MFNKFIITLLFPASVFAQTTFTSDTALEKVVEKDCDGKVFTKTEVLPSFKISKAAFEDSIMLYLRSKNAVIESSIISFRFVLSSNSKLLKINSGNLKQSPNKEILRDAILHFSDFLKPATQNSHIVCSYVTLSMEIRDGKINAAILQ